MDSVPAAASSIPGHANEQGTREDSARARIMLDSTDRIIVAVREEGIKGEEESMAPLQGLAGATGI
jgi:hypothetical protein